MNPLAITPEAVIELMHRLTPRQLEIVALLAQGNSNQATATILSISKNSVKKIILRACQRTNCNRVQLIVMFVIWKDREKSVTNPKG